MTSDFIHVLATRIGIGVYDEAWFDHRLRLFESITVPSMAAQTSQDFTWLLAIDRKMPPAAKMRFDSAVGALSNAAVVPVEFKSDFRRAVVSWSRRKAGEAGAPYVMTSRLDDDDALRVDAFERLQQEAEDFLKSSRHRYGVFSLNLGCMWIPSRRRGYTRYHDSHSLGLSLVEPAEECQCVYSRPHKEIKQRLAPRGAYIRGVDGDTLWWLYAAHSLSDSETGDQARIDKINNHRYGYDIDDALLASFGLDPRTIDAFSQKLEPESEEPTKFLSLRALEIEEQIKRARRKLRKTSRLHVLQRRRIRRSIENLEKKRQAAGSGIVVDAERDKADAQPGTAK